MVCNGRGHRTRTTGSRFSFHAAFIRSHLQALGIDHLNKIHIRAFGSVGRAVAHLAPAGLNIHGIHIHDGNQMMRRPRIHKCGAVSSGRRRLHRTEGDTRKGCRIVPGYGVGTVACAQRTARRRHPAFFTQEGKKGSAAVATKGPRTVGIQVVHFPSSAWVCRILFIQRSKENYAVRTCPAGRIAH